MQPSNAEPRTIPDPPKAIVAAQRLIAEQMVGSPGTGGILGQVTSTLEKVRRELAEMVTGDVDTSENNIAVHFLRLIDEGCE